MHGTAVAACVKEKLHHQPKTEVSVFVGLAIESLFRESLLSTTFIERHRKITGNGTTVTQTQFSQCHM